MKARIPVAVASAAIAIYCLPVVSDAARIPGRQLNPPNERYITGESDPWIPDNRLPDRALQAPPVTNALAPETEGARVQPAATHVSWYLRLLRLMHLFRLGGILR